MKMQRRALLGAMLASPFLAGIAKSSDRPLRIVVPFQAGSATDTAARIIGENLGKALGRSAVIDNKPGAEGLLAVKEVMRAEPAGDVLLFSTNTAITGINTFHPEPFYDPLTDLSPIIKIGDFPFLLVANASLPFQDVKAFLEYARTNPNRLTYASGSSSSIIAMAQLIDMAGLALHHIPYNSEPPAVIDLVGGRIDVMFATPTTTAGFIKEGKLRAMMTTTPARLVQFPDIPTMVDSGYASMPLVPWGGFFGPARMPAETRAALSQNIGAVLASPTVANALSDHHISVTTLNPDEFTDYLREQLDLSLQVVRKNNLTRK
ncbi:tripartite tricarboxylate transporter substrate binding protein [Verticiella sediminum]|uniref:Tripartite tricarboxylate transporter substrate binding protein n=1 Tax=Verticiella sediminum TaxID=1247510 RepID=A0A556AJ69_9BURK|nr:tripartite tricarboxylate transporter substrate binding protein [Verticiella sediminum]TSH92905.1 tripartite tricarboxylate transporter substrate binding protein [Verticiella sediminum]